MAAWPAGAGWPAFKIARHEWRLILKEPRFLLPFFITSLQAAQYILIYLYYI